MSAPSQRCHKGKTQSLPLIWPGSSGQLCHSCVHFQQQKIQTHSFEARTDALGLRLARSHQQREVWRTPVPVFKPPLDLCLLQHWAGDSSMQTKLYSKPRHSLLCCPWKMSVTGDPMRKEWVSFFNILFFFLFWVFFFLSIGGREWEDLETH